MNRKEYSIHENKILSMLLKYQIDNDISDEWLLRLLLNVAQSNVVRFKDDD